MGFFLQAILIFVVVFLFFQNMNEIEMTEDLIERKLKIGHNGTK